MARHLQKNGTRKIVEGDCRDVLQEQPGNSFDSVVTDPPYGLGFMGAGWDHGVPGVEFWEQVIRVLKPGAFLLAFGGTRTSHRLVCAIEDAGFEIRDSIVWIYGSGFPKSQDIGKAIDKAGRAKWFQEHAEMLVGHFPDNSIWDWTLGGHTPSDKWWNKIKELADGGHLDRRVIAVFEKSPGWFTQGDRYSVTAPATPEAQQWDGWGTALKPSHENICVARKPLSESTVAKNVLKHSTGGMNIDGARIGTGDESGRHPANLILQHHDDCAPVGTKRVKTGTTNSRKGTGSFAFGDHEKKTNPWVGEDGKEEVRIWECHPDCPVRLLDEQTGELSVTGNYTKSLEKPNTPRSFLDQKMGGRDRELKGKYAGERGGASRFYYKAKASPKERFFICRTCDTVDNDRKAHKDHDTINHPTQKPIELIRYLARLVTPPGGTILDPFVGSGTLAVAAKAEGFNYLGIDSDPDYCRIARYRSHLKI